MTMALLMRLQPRLPCTLISLLKCPVCSSNAISTLPQPVWPLSHHPTQTGLNLLMKQRRTLILTSPRLFPLSRRLLTSTTRMFFTSPWYTQQTQSLNANARHHASQRLNTHLFHRRRCFPFNSRHVTPLVHVVPLNISMTTFLRRWLRNRPYQLNVLIARRGAPLLTSLYRMNIGWPMFVTTS